MATDTEGFPAILQRRTLLSMLTFSMSCLYVQSVSIYFKQKKVHYSQFARHQPKTGWYTHLNVSQSPSVFRLPFLNAFHAFHDRYRMDMWNGCERLRRCSIWRAGQLHWQAVKGGGTRLRAISYLLIVMRGCDGSRSNRPRAVYNCLCHQVEVSIPAALTPSTIRWGWLPGHKIAAVVQ